MTDVDHIEAIRQLKARYFRLMDTKDWAAFRELFTADVRIDVSADGAGVFEGLDAFLAMLLPALDNVVTVHHGHMPEIQLTSDTTASGIWAMEDRLQFPDGGPVGGVHGWGHYHDTYRLVDGQWRIESSRLTRLRMVLS
jgi:hypothetical protein